MVVVVEEVVEVVNVKTARHVWMMKCFRQPHKADSAKRVASGCRLTRWLIPFMGYFVPLFLSYGCFLLGEGCFVRDDKRGWEDKDAIVNGAQLYINCCAPGGCLTYQKGRAEKLAEKRERASTMEMQTVTVAKPTA